MQDETPNIGYRILLAWAMKTATAWGQSAVLTQTPMLQYLAPQPTKAASTNVTG
ncbi:hypothetical protein ALO54_101575 [Pseudomonas syringae pv. philadelphi]|nr:hypothetical protein ALO86_101401 [Pseudomonas syringae pv. berberidis]KPY11985.1 hypothetical protein ALO54_101575 [Pseudomonas syringae pv. philadelphi]RMM35909.1 hypothetical protein ALQ83_101625 [Pseudomonas syringae pv. berberidis]RMP64054.1 hypothetical protein ALQ19_101640 [Pseudomonas syringae pv. berberidis]RMQ37135.1 hypothetical protein ALQ06_101586 [Pseudomonas syringae pv. berberidis]